MAQGSSAIQLQRAPEDKAPAPKRRVIRPTEKRIDLETYYKSAVSMEVLIVAQPIGVSVRNWGRAAAENLRDALR